MNQPPESSAASFGGDWTRDKLAILERYLDAYTTALKYQPFKLMYIDAFAGAGRISLRAVDDEARAFSAFIDGSAKLAIEIKDKPFDRLIFVEEDTHRYNQLTALWRNNPDRDIRVLNWDANRFLGSLEEDWRAWRGVLFLDPFATEVEWATVERIAAFHALDTWLLFPINAIARILPVSKNPDDVSSAWAARLTRIFGDESWRNLYHVRPQQSLFGEELYERDAGTAGISQLYKDKLRKLFGDRYMETTTVFQNSRNSPLFKFIFCVGNEAGIGPAKRIAQHILRAEG